MNDRTKTTPGRSVAVARRPGAGSAQEFVRGVITELRRVTWPTREEWVSATVLTLILVIGIGLFTYAVDQIVGAIFGFIQHK